MSTNSTWQMELRGLLMGRGTPYRFAAAPEGLGLPALRTNDMAWLADDGAYGAGDWMQPRLVRARLWVDAGDAAASETAARTLVGAWAPSRTDLPLELRVAAKAYLAYGRPRRCEIDLAPLKYGHAEAAVEFAALDPYLYDTELVQGVVKLSDSLVLQGVTPNLTFDLRFQPAGTAGPGVVFCTNTGTAPAALTATFTGPAINPRIENRTTGKTFRLDATLASSDVAVVDMRARSITVNGTARLDLLAAGADWVPLAAGVNEVAYRSSDATPTDSTVTLAWRGAWH
jgi:hypothetical protein